MAEKLVNEFTVNRPIDEAWSIICDIERIAPCMPGAQLDEIDGEVFRGVVKVKLGAIMAQFKGEASIVERDCASHRARMVAGGRDTGGRGKAEADVAAAAVALTPESTRCVVTTEIRVTGKLAQFGRGVMGEVSRKLMDQFADNLNTMLDAHGPAAAATSSTADPQAGADESDPSEPDTGGHVRVASAVAEPIDLAALAGPALLKRLAPAAAVALVTLLLICAQRRSRA